jgi:hypothetical protein
MDPATAFQQNCLNLITGQGTKWRTRGVSLDPSLFMGSNGPAVAFIMTPRENQPDFTEENPNLAVPGPDTQLYPAQMGLLAGTLATLMTEVLIVFYNYFAINDAFTTEQYQGKALFEYDPNADGSNNPDFRLWYEQNYETGSALGIIG